MRGMPACPIQQGFVSKTKESWFGKVTRFVKKFVTNPEEPEFSPSNPQGGRRELTSTCMLWHSYIPRGTCSMT